MKFLRALCFLSLALSGCVFRESAPTLTGMKIPDARVKEVISEFEYHRQKISDVRALIRVKMTHGHETQSFRYAVVYRRPDSLRVEVFPLNSFYTLSLLTVLRDRLVSLNTSDSTAITGSPTRDSIERAFGLPLSIEEISNILLGEIPKSVTNVSGVQNEDNSIEKYISADNRVYFEKSAVSPQLQKLKLYDESEKLIIEVRFLSFKDIGGVLLPDKLELLLPQYDVASEMMTSSMSVNSHPLDSLFVAEPPSQYTVTPLE